MTNASILDELYLLLGSDVVLLPVQSGTKKCVLRAWQKLQVEQTKDEISRMRLMTSNIAVALGTQSGGLISIDFDEDEAAKAFLKANPRFEKTLQTRGSRGKNIWLRMDGNYPSSAKIMHRHTEEPVGEWRSTGNYTVIHGKHPSGVDYHRLFDGPPLRAKYEEIVWPVHLGINEPPRPVQKVPGRPLSQTMIENRRELVETLLEEVEWTDDTEADCACPGKDLHTNANGPKDCRVKIDGVPTVFCLHTSCHDKVKAVNGVLRRTVRSQEVVLLPDDTVRVGEAAEQLFTILNETKLFYLRGSEVSEMVNGVNGPELRLVNKTRAVSAFDEFVTFGVRKSKDGQESIKQCPLPEQWASVFLQAKQKTILPPIDNVVTIPILFHDVTGALRVHENRYNYDTRTYVANPDPSKRLPSITLQEATELLKDLLTDFNFESRSHRSRALASFITPAMVFSGLLGGRPPVDVAEADQSQSGKNFRHKLVCYIYGEKPCPITQRKRGVGGLDESIAEALIRGKPFPQLDNLRGHIDSTFLESFLTADGPIGARGFGRGEIQINPERFCTLITSNELKLTPDLANRSSIIRIRKQRVNYPWKSYGGLRLDEHVKLNHLLYLAAVYRVVQEWYNRGCQKLHRGHHDFLWWAGRLDWIIENLFPGEAPLLDGHQSVQERAGDPRLGWWQQIAFEVEKQGRLLQPLQMVHVRDVCLDAGLEIFRKPGQEGRTFANDADELKYLGSMFASLFKGTCRLELDGFAVQKKEVSDQRADGSTYPVKAYMFTRAGAVAEVSNGGNVLDSETPFTPIVDDSPPAAA